MRWASRLPLGIEKTALPLSASRLTAILDIKGTQNSGRVLFAGKSIDEEVPGVPGSRFWDLLWLGTILVGFPAKLVYWCSWWKSRQMACFIRLCLLTASNGIHLRRAQQRMLCEDTEYLIEVWIYDKRLLAFLCVGKRSKGGPFLSEDGGGGFLFMTPHRTDGRTQKTFGLLYLGILIEKDSEYKHIKDGRFIYKFDILSPVTLETKWATE
ncbi:hypothetical protein HNY73_023021 [Argiope bruennichi]|uniref:Uncharacterized protein n=1 Tax=Argiope bruennichi TaxID=94029 RepID=A0A8T0E569_ARGBR|nr:hypothetical protein HNY73_023021 [Argiope bruennichi]